MKKHDTVPIAAARIGLVLLVAATLYAGIPRGAVLTVDSLVYASTARSLVAGKGFIGVRYDSTLKLTLIAMTSSLSVLLAGFNVQHQAIRRRPLFTVKQVKALRYFLPYLFEWNTICH